MLKIIFMAGLVAGMLFLASGQAQAVTNLSLYPLKVEVKEGQAFRVLVGVNPNGVMNYTIKSTINFPADLLFFQNWTYANDWMPIKKVGYDSSGNVTGTLVRTAGYAGGFDKVTSFGSVDFVAIKSGVGVIKFAGEGLALDSNNNNLYGGGNQLSVVVVSRDQVKPARPLPTTLESANPPVGEQVPRLLFGITLETDKYEIAKIEDLNSRVTFTGFGEIPMSVDLIFDLLDARGQVVHTEKDLVVVETEEVFNKSFTGLTLPAGKYTLRLKTTYNSLVKGEFSQPFAIAPRVPGGYSKWVYGGLILLLFLVVAVYLKKSKR